MADRYIELCLPEKAVAGQTAAKEPLILRITDDGYLIAKVRALDIDDTGNDIDLVCTPDGALKTAIDFVLGDLTVTMGDLEKLLAGTYWQRDKPYLYGSGRVKYLCKNTDKDAEFTTTTWRIWKFTDAAISEREGPRVGRADSAANIDGDHTWKI